MQSEREAEIDIPLRLEKLTDGGRSPHFTIGGTLLDHRRCEARVALLASGDAQLTIAVRRETGVFQ